MVRYGEKHPECRRPLCLHVRCFLHRRWKYNNEVYQYWVEFEESGELTKLYLQRQDHVESKDAQNTRELQKLSTDKPFSFEGALTGAPLQPPALGNEKPKAELEVKAGSCM